MRVKIAELMDVENVEVGNQSLSLLHADEPHLRYMGMSMFDSQDDFTDDGMLFEYPQEELHRVVFRDMNFDLTVLLLDSDMNLVDTGMLDSDNEAVEGVCQYIVELPRSDFGPEELGSESRNSPVMEDNSDAPVIIDETEVDVGDEPSVFTGVYAKRVYIDDPTEVPEGADVHEGARGGLYYEETEAAFSQMQMEDDMERMEKYDFTQEQINEAADTISDVSQSAEDIFGSWVENAQEVANVTGASHRTKSIGSAMEKVYKRKPELYDEVSDLNDLHGSMVKVETVDEAEEIFNHLQEQEEFEIIEAKDKMGDGPYRAYHLIAEVEGQTAELQIKQEDLSEIATASHKLAYKPDTAPHEEMDSLDGPADEELQTQLNNCLEQMSGFIIGDVDEVSCAEQSYEVIEEYMMEFA